MGGLKVERHGGCIVAIVVMTFACGGKVADENGGIDASSSTVGAGGTSTVDTSATGGVGGCGPANSGCGGSVPTIGSCQVPRVPVQTWCAEELDLVAEALGDCRFALPNLPDLSLEKFKVVIVPDSGGYAEVQTYGGPCARFDPGESAWSIDYSSNPPEIILCSCSCAHLAEGGKLVVIYGCGGGPVWMG
jgi:hypothetical protein